MQAVRVQLSDALRSTPLCPPTPLLAHDGGNRIEVPNDHLPAVQGKLVDVLILSHTDLLADDIRDVAFRELLEQEGVRRDELSDALNATLHRHAYLVCNDGAGYRVDTRRPHIVQDGGYALALYPLAGRPRRWVPHSLVLPADHHGPRSLAQVAADLMRTGQLSGDIDKAQPQFFRSEAGAHAYHIVCASPAS